MDYLVALAAVEMAGLLAGEAQLTAVQAHPVKAVTVVMVRLPLPVTVAVVVVVPVPLVLLGQAQAGVTVARVRLLQ